MNVEPTIPLEGERVTWGTTVNEADAEFEAESVAAIVWDPASDAGTANVQLKLPELDVTFEPAVHVRVVVTSHVSETLLVPAKPVPVRVGWLPTMPLVGETVRSESTVNVVEAVFDDASDAETVCAQWTAYGTLNEQPNAPVPFVARVQTETALVDANVTVIEDPEAKPLPSTVTELPTIPWAEPGAVISRLAETENEADALFDDPSVALTVWLPCVAGGTANVAVKLPRVPVENDVWGAEGQEAPPVQVRACAPSQVIVTVEEAAKPVPVTVTVSPTIPEGGETLIFGSTVKTAVALLWFVDVSVPVNV